MESNNTQVIINKLTEIKSQQDRIEQKLNTLLKKDNANNCKKSYKDYSAKEVSELRQRTSNIILGGLLLWHSQMKKCHKEPLTKSTISEVYAGMHARKGTTVTSLPVPYGNYGNLMRVILYNYTKDVVWIKTLPESQPALGIQSMRNRMIDEANLDFEQSQTYLDRASSLERKAREQRQKALDIQKSAVYRALQACSFFKKEHKQSSATANTLDDYTEYKNIHFYRLVCSPCFKTTLIKHVYYSFFKL